MVDQRNFINELFEEKSFCLVIFDACRYDIFFELSHELFPNVGYFLRKVESPASCTIEWLKACFPGFYKVTYYSGNPHVNPRVAVHGYKAWEHFADIVFVWKEWDRRLYTLKPEKMNEIVRRRVPKYPRVIIHYIQPHMPPCFEHKYIQYLKEPPLGFGADIFFFDLVKRKIIPAEEYRRLYIENLKYVARELNKILPFLLKMYDSVVITSDHGELLGERNLLGHPCNIKCRELREVPWCEIW